MPFPEMISQEGLAVNEHEVWVLPSEELGQGRLNQISLKINTTGKDAKQGLLCTTFFKGDF